MKLFNITFQELMESSQLINSIYRATEGEGIFLGRPQIFVRYQGCTVGCINCDSKETWDFDGGLQLNVSTILEKIKLEGHNGLIKNVSITGGDPLHPKHVPHVLNLVKNLKDLGYYINLEAAGTRIVDEIFAAVDYISFDIKTPSTNVKTPIDLVLKLAHQYTGKFQIKSVIQDRRDFDYILGAREYLLKESNQELNFPWVLTPSYNVNEEFPMKRFIDVLEWNEFTGGNFRVIGQQHKWIFGPDKKDV